MMNEQKVNYVQGDVSQVMGQNPAAIVVAEAKDEIALVTPAQLMNPTSTAMYCSLKDDGSAKSKADIYNAINSPDEKLAEHIGEVIELVHILAHEVQLPDEETGEIIRCLRCVLVDKAGKTYEAVSGGVANSISRMLQIFGQPETWTAPIKVKAKQKATRNGNNKVTTLEIVG